MSRTIDRFRRSGFVRDTATLSAGTAIAQLLGVATMPILSRLYTPTDYGILALFISVSTIVAMAGTLRYEMAILLPKDDGEAAALVALCFCLAVTSGAALTVLAWWVPPSVQRALGLSAMGPWLPVAVAAGTVGALVAAGTAWLNRGKAYLTMTALRVAQSAALPIVGIALGLYGIHSGQLIAQLASLFVVTGMMTTRLPFAALRQSLRSLRAVSRAHRSIPVYQLPTSFLDLLSLQLPIFLISARFSSALAGQYSMAWRILGFPMVLVGGAAGQVFFQRVAQTWPDKGATRRLLHQTWTMLLMVGVPPAVTMFFFAKPLFTWLLGGRWATAGEFAAVLAPMLLTMLVSAPTSSVVLVLGLQRLNPAFGLSALAYRVGTLYYASFVGDLKTGLELLVVCEVLHKVCYNLVIWRRIR